MDDESNVLKVRCSEPDGEIVRTVKLCELSIVKLHYFWEKMKDFDVLFNDFVRGDVDAFINHFILQVDGQFVPAGLIWEVDDVGIFLLNEIRVEHSGMAHFVFWDQRFRGREDLCRKMVEYVFETYNLRRIWTEVPVYAKWTMRAVERIGFVREGRLRQTNLYKGEWFDSNIYSILRGETFGAKKHSIAQVCFTCGETYSGDVNGTES